MSITILITAGYYIEIIECNGYSEAAVISVDQFNDRDDEVHTTYNAEIAYDIINRNEDIYNATYGADTAYNTINRDDEIYNTTCGADSKLGGSYYFFL